MPAPATNGGSFEGQGEAVTERLLPSLLDRLTDDEPGPGPGRYADRVVTFQQYRRGVQRDLEWLLSASGHLPHESIAAFPEVRSSVLNLGVPSMQGQTETALLEEQFRLRVIEAIRRFEPRVLRQGLAVSVTAQGNVMTVQIHGQLWAIPAPERFQIQSSIDLETGRCEFGGISRG
jgi:type VI secretion system protein ImpF